MVCILSGEDYLFYYNLNISHGLRYAKQGIDIGTLKLSTMFYQKISLLLVIVLLMSACHANPEAEERAMNQYLASADSVVSSSSPDIADLTSDARKVIRKADIKCRVNDVQQAVAELEDFAVFAGGFVQHSHTENNIVSEKTGSYNGDSLKTAQVYRTTASMVIRVPVYALDTLAAHIVGLATFVHHRDMSREDVTLQFLSNTLKSREAKKLAVVPETGNGKKERETMVALSNQASQQVDRRIANLDMVDNSRYATLSLEVYQPEQVFISITRDADKLVTPGFWEQIVTALGKSAGAIKAIILAVITTWPVWIIALLILWWYKRATLAKTTISKGIDS